MIHYRCYLCGRERDLHDRNLTYLQTTDVLFCTVDCLVKFIKSKPYTTPRDLYDGVLPLHCENRTGNSDTVCWSHRLGTSFRSGFEAMVAEVLVLKYELPLLYESLQLVLNGRREMRYIPDFYVREHGVFLEVKGGWRGKGHIKYNEAQSVIGRERMLLIPPFYRSWFKFLARKLEKAHGIQDIIR